MEIRRQREFCSANRIAIDGYIVGGLYGGIPLLSVGGFPRLRDSRW